MYISRLRMIVGATAAAIGFSLLGAGTAFAVQTHMLNARDDLQSAQNQLQQAIPDKDGHRVDAINLVQQAIDQVNLGIQAGAQ
ncbi:hypothetical protein Y900_008460 [Mycolicibacterium aromaticivorans JS19b1 = JCM 16368]|uniref:Uncharacterized protein n=1 Tax=Mycolicibacterium aromaticivorans JS19b1 = JCM 16368 TaxID=1440774 RepID=A0A064CED5_9MYCO|nr:hypothetical protein [Mycolicibacterium aromaticivorans]KDE98979.1 hypothetical protein Y900_008460 [Mycolicibacterium aromaticivorans JS19b1 = JCM 16368]